MELAYRGLGVSLAWRNLSDKCKIGLEKFWNSFILECMILALAMLRVYLVAV